ncbi:helix-turn-helix domain-containing protein [Corynebacterium qintianiae]|uniref:Helix-turn-helix domain-containing protein n=1 Tax=Corynebacterium qintianiae TaxID=2709392 RepID=A0A7T0KN31_9CORY|nr:helix-turn-helix domain-containing protein [Corynebacterium qintianiae]
MSDKNRKTYKGNYWYMSPEEVMAFLSISKATLNRMVADGVLPCSVPYGRVRRFKSSDVERLMEKSILQMV